MIDLHSHSMYSDGSETPEHVVELAARAGCSTVALTDHDGLSGIARAHARALSLGINFIAGCEVSCAFSPGSMHVLCYFVESGPGALQDELVSLQRDRDERNRELITRLNALGIPITLSEVQQEAKGTTIGRPHFAAVLMKHKVVETMNEAFDRYLAKGAAAYVSKAHVSPDDIIAKNIESGTVPVIAHPLTLGLSPNDLDREIGRLASIGLGGIECYYGRYDDDTRKTLVAMAQRHHIVATGGSDFHGSYKPDIEMGRGTGDLCVPDEVVDELIEKRSLLSAKLPG